MPETPSVLLDIGHEVVGSLAERCATRAGLSLLDKDSGQTPDLLLRLAGTDIQAEAAFLDDFARAHPQTDVILLGDPGDTGALVWAMRLGVLDFLPMTLGEDDLTPRLAAYVRDRLKRRGGQPGKGRLVSVLAVKGGAGATTVAVNLAHGLQKLAAPQDVSVALVDLGLPYGEAQMFLDLPCQHDWGDAVKNLSRLDASYLLGLMTRHASGLRLLPPPARPEELQVAGAEAMGFVVEQARKIFDVVVLDLGGYLDEIALKLVDRSDDTLLVGVQSVACVRNLRRVAGLFAQGGDVPRGARRLVVNRHLPQSSLTVADMEAACGLKAFWLIPNDYAATMGAINQGLPLAEYAPKSPVARQMAGLAQALARTGQEGAQVGQAKPRRRFALPWSGA